MKLKFIIIFFYCFLSFGCNNSNNEKIELFYFKHLITTPIQVDCNTIYGYSGLRKIEIKENKEIDIFIKQLEMLKTSSIQESIDVRYKLIYLTDTICLDVFGGVIYNSKRMEDSHETLVYVKGLIDKYKDKAMKGENEVELPPLPSN